MKEIKPPRAKKIRKRLTKHGHTRVDNYYWLNQRENEDVIQYLKDENAYTNKLLNKPTQSLQDTLYKEMVDRIPQKDLSVPYDLKGFSYYTRYEEGLEYPVYCRRRLMADSPEEVMLDGNALAKGHRYFYINNWEVSPDNRLLAYSVDTLSRRKYSIYFKDLITGEVWNEHIKNTTGDIAWANDNKTVFYSVRDRSLRPYKIYKHVLGTPVKDNQLVYHEKDATFDVSVYKSKSEKYVIISSESTLSTECRILPADLPDQEFKVFQARQNDVEYQITHQGNRFLVLTNHHAKNFSLMETPEDQTEINHWRELIPHREKVLIEELEVFRDFIVVSERENGLIRFRIFNLKTGEKHYMPFDEADYHVFMDDNYEYDSPLFRYGYTSLKTPQTIYEYDMLSGERNLKKRHEVVGGYNPDAYVNERLYAKVRDGVEVPLSVVYKKGFKKDGSQPVLLYAYGSYGISIDSEFRSSRLSLLDRGFAFVVAHIRGGQEMGREWYEDGKLLKKKNTFNDFIDAARFLIQQKYTSPKRLFAMGGSAGGLLMGAVVNEAPRLFKGVVAAVPFVDVVTTMLDESIPLTTGEYDEWGNPNEKEYYDYMLSYSPYDNVKKQDYPAMLVTTGLHDSQVQYWEPAKWVAKLRTMKTDRHLLFLWTNMDFGHGGASGRFEAYKEIAMEYAFMLFLLE
jgi:oligopeptidase B